MDVRTMLLESGVRNLKEYGYPSVNAENILTDRIFSAFFKTMLEENKGRACKNIDTVIDMLLAEIESNTKD